MNTNDVLEKSPTDLAGERTEAITTATQSIAASGPENIAPPAPTVVATNSAGTIVPSDFRFTETQYEPTADLTSEEVSKLSQNDLLTGIRKQYSSARR